MRTSPVDGFRPRSSADPEQPSCTGFGGAARVPRSKSIAQRALLCARLASGVTRLAALPQAEDVRHVANALGVALEGGDATIEGRPPSLHGGLGAGPPVERVDVGESGTGARLVTAALGLCGRPGSAVRVGGSGSLARRSSPALFATLERAGVRLEHEGRADGWPVRLTPTGPPSELLLVDPTSSQEVSALLIALAAYPGTGYLRVRGILPSAPYVVLTQAVLSRFGVGIETEPPHTQGEQTFVIRGPLQAPAAVLTIEADASAAAVALAAGCLAGGEVSVRGLGAGSAQGDVRIVEHLARFGCSTRADVDELRASGAPTRGASIDLAGEPDLAPVLVSVAAVAALRIGARSRLTGLGTLPGKESSRIEVLARGLAALGLEVGTGPEHITIAPGAPTAAPVVLDPAGDHRMAFAFALLGLVRAGVAVQDPGCVAKSWPGFWDDLEALGALRIGTGNGDSGS